MTVPGDETIERSLFIKPLGVRQGSACAKLRELSRLIQVEAARRYLPLKYPGISPVTPDGSAVENVHSGCNTSGGLNTLSYTQ